MSCILTIYNLDDPILQLDCFNASDRLTYSVPLLQIYQHEIHLNHGRFRLFSDTMPLNKVYLRHDARIDVPLCEWMRSIVNWINEVNKISDWSFSGRMLDDHRSEFAFGFENVTISFMFAMVWV